MKRGGLITGIVAVVAGILVLIFPGIIQWVVGIFLIFWGILSILGR